VGWLGRGAGTSRGLRVLGVQDRTDRHPRASSKSLRPDSTAAVLAVLARNSCFQWGAPQHGTTKGYLCLSPPPMPPSPVLLLILALVVPPPAASFRPQHPPREFGQLDRDADSSVSLEEVESHLDARLEAEIEAFLAFFDADGGGSVTAAEYGAKAGQFFDTDPRTEEWFWRSLMPHPPPDDESTLCVRPVQRRLGAGWLSGLGGCVQRGLGGRAAQQALAAAHGHGPGGRPKGPPPTLLTANPTPVPRGRVGGSSKGV